MITERVLVLGATMRLTRLVVTDDLGEWLIKAPLFEAAEFWPNSEEEPSTWQGKAVSGLDCPFCVGFWIGAGVLAITAATRDTPLQRPWRFVMAALTLNEVAAHAGARLGDAG